MVTLKATDHSYYCSDSNYYSNDASCEYETWEEFKDDWGIEEVSDLDCDRNLCFRYDVFQQYGEDDETLIDAYGIKLFFMLQRKGKFSPVTIDKITEEDLPEINDFLRMQWRTLKTYWDEIRGVVVLDGGEIE